MALPAAPISLPSARHAARVSTRPASLLLALEPRLMFDGAAAVTAADAATVHVERHAAAEVTTGASSAAHASGAQDR
ncbi:MAG: LEPR-XLL domain-containing protein, partial [Acidobacteriaceae bacterium]|nr:LEPR-XLL domain-containing protein [Acidobacteriaceae bacterium]